MIAQAESPQYGPSNGPVCIYLPFFANREFDSIVSISNGTQEVSNLEDAGIRYAVGARIPVQTWRTVNSEEQRLLYSATWLGAHRTVAVLPIVDHRFALSCRRNLVALNTPFENDEAIWDHPFLGQLLEHIKTVCDIAGPVTFKGVAAHAGDQMTVTIDRGRKVKLGLHIDNWDHTGLGNADFVRNRISINLGPDDRFFLFVSLTLRQLAASLGISTNAPLTKAELTRRFFKCYPNHPVVRLRIRPGWAYVAPTENIVHDGSSKGTAHEGYHITFHGLFSALDSESFGMERSEQWYTV